MNSKSELLTRPRASLEAIIYFLRLFKLEVPDFPAEEQSTTRRVVLEPELYIERSDFLPETKAGFRRLTPTQPVGIRYAGLVISVKEIHKVHLNWQPYMCYTIPEVAVYANERKRCF